VLRPGFPDPARLVERGKGGILQDQTHHGAIQGKGCVCDLSQKRRQQHQVRFSSVVVLSFSTHQYYFFNPRVHHMIITADLGIFSFLAPREKK
jgi:hypothetical protein